MLLINKHIAYFASEHSGTPSTGNAEAQPCEWHLEGKEGRRDPQVGDSQVSNTLFING